MLTRAALTRRWAGPAISTRITLAWFERSSVVVGLAVGLTLIFAYRLAMVRSYPGLGVDAGNYLATMRQVFGADIIDGGLQRPPLIGIVLWPLACLFGPLMATKLAAVGASVLMGVPFYLLCSRFTRRGVAALFSLLFVLSPRYMEAMNWGFLTLVGVGLFTLNFYLIHELLTAQGFDRRRALLLGLFSLALAAANRSSAFIYVAAALALGNVLVLTGGRDRRGALRLAPAALLVMLLSLPFLSTYADVSWSVGDRAFVTVARSPGDLREAFDALARFFDSGGILIWVAAAGLALIGAGVLRRRTRVSFSLFLALLVAPLAVCLLTIGEIAERSAYFLYLPLWLGTAVSADAGERLLEKRRAVPAGAAVWGAAALALVLGSMAWTSHGSLGDAGSYFGFLDSEHVDAIETADGAAPAGSGVTYPWPLASWTAGLAGRKVVSTSHPLFTGERVATNGLAFVADAYSTGDVPMDPAIGVDTGAWKQLLYLDDRLMRVGCARTDGMRQVTLGDAPLQHGVTTEDGAAWFDTRTYVFDGLQVVKKVRLAGQGNQVMVTLTADCGTGSAARLLVPLQPAFASLPVSMTDRQAIFGFRGWQPFTSEWSASAQVDVEGGSGAESVLAVVDKEQSGTNWQTAGQIIAAARVDSSSPRTEMTLVFTVSGWPSGDGEGLRTYSAEEAIRDQNVTFAVVDRQPAKPWFGDPLAVPVAAWLDEGPYFQRLSDDGRVAAYRVAVPPAAGDRPAGMTP